MLLIGGAGSRVPPELELLAADDYSYRTATEASDMFALGKMIEALIPAEQLAAMAAIQQLFVSSTNREPANRWAP